MLKVETDGPILNITLDRPDVRNSFNDELIAALSDTFKNIEPAIRVILLQGEGKVFCAGGDLNWMKKAANYTPEQNKQDALKLAALFQSMLDCPAVIIAKVHGAAFGGGCGLVAAADVAICALETKFSFSEVRLGLIPATISPFVLPKIGPGHARSLFTTGEVFDGAKAERIGLVHDAVTLDQLHILADARINDVLRNGPEAVAKSKWLAQQPPLPAEQSAELLALARAGAEATNGINAFLDKQQAPYVVDRS